MKMRWHSLSSGETVTILPMDSSVSHRGGLQKGQNWNRRFSSRIKVVEPNHFLAGLLTTVDKARFSTSPRFKSRASAIRSNVPSVGFRGLLSRRLTIDWLSPASADKRLIESPRFFLSLAIRRISSALIFACRSALVTLQSLHRTLP